MPWIERTAMSERLLFIEEVLSSKDTKSSICEKYGVSRTTGYYWKKRYERYGKSGLKNRSRRPHNSPNQTPAEIESLCIEVQKQHPTWGGVKIHRHLSNQGYTDLPTSKTINRILKRHGYVSEVESEKHRAWIRFEHEYPNDLWQMDFKGHVIIHGKAYYPLTLLDDHSRYCLCVQVCEDQGTETVKQVLTDVFRKHGLPKQMTMDNGVPWGSSQGKRYSKLAAWLMRLGITVSYSRPMHPQTQGKLERMHRTLKEDCLKRFTFENGDELQRGFNWWRDIYNNVRPHGALNLDCPVDHYKVSDNTFPEVLPEIKYESDLIVKKVKYKGHIKLEDESYLISAAFKGLDVGLKKDEINNSYDVFFCHQKIGVIDLNQY